MRRHSITTPLTLILALALAACQMFTGLDQLHPKQDDVSTQPVSDPEHNRSEMDAAAASDTKLTKSGSVEHEPSSMPEKEAPKNQATTIAPDASVSDAGALPASPFGVPQVPSNGGRGAVAPVAGDAGRGMSGNAGGSAAEPAANGGTGGASNNMQPVAAGCTPPAPGGPECVAAPQCGCDPSENCAVLTDRLTCLRAGPVGEHQGCNVVADCMPGYECLLGACMKLCDAAHADCSGGAQCLPITSAAGAQVAGANFCESNCNPIDPQKADAELRACGPSLICLYSGTGTRCAQSKTALGIHGTRCTDQLQCASGYTCKGDSGTCAKWCLAASDCPSGFSCSMDGATTIAKKAFGTCKPNCLDRNEQVCGLTTQCGCDAAHSCSAVPQGPAKITHECRVLGSSPKYGRCQFQTDCGRGNTCVTGECQPNCLTELECERYARCEFSYFDETPLVPASAACKRACDPADQHRAHGSYSACNANEACEVADDGYSFCRSASLRGTVGVSCSNTTDCASGNTCISAGYCVQLCRNNVDCNTGTCRAFSTSQFAETVEWGYCDTSR